MTLQHKFMKNNRTFAKLFVFGIAAFFGLLRDARADLIISAQKVTVNAGSSGDGLDVELENTGPSAVTIAAFSFGVMTTNPDIVFEESNVVTSAPYIFAGKSTFGPDITVTNGQTITASDLDTSLAGVILTSGSRVGLGHLLFSVPPGAASGTFAVTLLGFPTTSLGDDQAHDVPIQSLSPGAITIQTVTAVPEPSAWAIFAAGIAFLLIFLPRRRIADSITDFPAHRTRP